MSKYLKLNSGSNLPTVGLGTWQLKADDAEEVLVTAVKAGYRHFDCAKLYGNEAPIGKALAHIIKDLKLVKREELFVTSKLWCNSHKKDDVRPVLKQQLEDLQLEYLDLYLIHFPISMRSGPDLFPVDSDGSVIYDNVPPTETWKAMEECVKEGLAKNIGLSNFNISQIKNILKHAEIKPAALQVEVYPYFQNQKIIDFCVSNNIPVIGYSCLGSMTRTWDEIKLNPMEDPVIKKLAGKYKKSPAQIILRWLVQRNIAVIPKSSNLQRIKENIEIFDFELASKDLADIATLEKGLRNFGKSITLNGNVLFQHENMPYYSFKED